MSRNAVVAKRYAKALFEVAQAQGIVAEAEEQLQQIAGTFTSDGEVGRFLETPNIETSVKIATVKKAIGDRVSSIVLSTVTLLIERGRHSAIRDVYAAYSRIAGEATGRVHATIYSAKPLSASEEKKVTKQFGALTGKQIIGETVVDASLLGGIRVRIGDTVYDGSLSGKLERLRKTMNSQAL